MAGIDHTRQWSQVWLGDYQAFTAMAELMTTSGIDLQGNAPIWAWVGAPNPKTVERTAFSLLPANQLEQGIDVIEFDAPDQLVTVTDYHTWQAVYLQQSQDALETWKSTTKSMPAAKGAQATLATLKFEWLRRLQILHLADSPIWYCSST